MIPKRKAQTFILETGLPARIQMVIVKQKIAGQESGTMSDFVNEAIKAALKKAEK